MKLVLVSAIVLLILPFNICFGNLLGAPSTIPVSQVERFKPTIEDFIKNSQNGNDWIYVDTIKNATSQVVAGASYKIEFSAIKTDCSKDDLTKNKKNCKVKDQQHCSVSIWEKSWENFLQIKTMNCMGIKLEIN